MNYLQVSESEEEENTAVNNLKKCSYTLLDGV